MRALENADRIREALARLPTANRADLRAEWLRLYPSKLRRELLMAAIASYGRPSPTKAWTAVPFRSGNKESRIGKPTRPKEQQNPGSLSGDG
jgi:hypothetical protein